MCFYETRDSRSVVTRLCVLDKCRYDHYELRNGTLDCYTLVSRPLTFFQARDQCELEGALVVIITNRNENEYVKGFLAGALSDEFWIGLTDDRMEGQYEWLNGDNIQGDTKFRNWATGEPDNSNNRDCVLLSREGWTVATGGCAATTASYMCEQIACKTTDNKYCVGEEPESQTSDNTAVIVSGALVPIILIAVTCIILWYIWKYQNDFWSKYICFLCHLQSKDSVSSLEKENQRLRHELSLRRTVSDIQKDYGRNNSLTSGLFLPLARSPDPMPAIPDGQGGMLPSIKSQVQNLPDGKPQPPPLQRQTSRISNNKVTPLAVQQKPYNTDQYTNRDGSHSFSPPSPPFAVPMSPPPTTERINIPASFASALAKNQATQD